VTGLALHALLNQPIEQIRSTFAGWGQHRAHPYQWRSFYAVCGLLALLDECVPERNGVQPTAAAWAAWTALFEMLSAEHLEEAKYLLQNETDGLRKCLVWIRNTGE
jgi:hypothetical protein